jgi:hypothetical protein
LSRARLPIRRPVHRSRTVRAADHVLERHIHIVSATGCEGMRGQPRSGGGRAAAWSTCARRCSR